MENSISDLFDAFPKDNENDKIEEWAKQLCDFCRSNERYSYSEITQYIFNSNGGIEYAGSILYALEKISNREDIDSGIKKKIFKMSDHIRLEIVRYEQIMKAISTSVQESYEGMTLSNHDAIDKALNVMTEEMGRLNVRAKEIEELSCEAERKVTASQAENVAILGIFASIVFAFTGLLSLSTSVLENLATVSAYRVFAIFIFIGFVFLNVIGVLVGGIKRIVYYKSRRMDDKRSVSIKDIFKENVMFIIGDLILVVGMVVVILMWNHSTEKQILDLNRDNYIQDLQDNLQPISGNDIFITPDTESPDGE